MRNKMKKIGLIIILVLLLTESAIAQWQQLSFPVTTDLRSVAFCNADTGFVVTANKVYRTTNGGTTWSVSATAVYEIYDVCVAEKDKKIVYAVGGYMTFDIINITQEVHNIFLKTTNYGETWQSTIDGSGIGESRLEYVYFYNDRLGFVNGSCGPFISNNSFKRTTNGGLNWEAMNGLQTSVYLRNNVDFVNDTVAYANGNSGGVFKTTNEGNDWVNLISGQGIKLDFVNEQKGYRIAGGIYYTINGGQTWLPTADSGISRSNEDVADLLFSTENTGYVAGHQGDIFKTFDGFTWKKQSSPTTNFLNKIAAIDSIRLYIVGANGAILKTTNGGVLSLPSQTPQPLSFKLEQNYPNPFNPATVIGFTMKRAGEATIRIYNTLGMLVSEKKMTVGAGRQEYRFDASSLASGTYFYQLNTVGFSQTRKMQIVK